MTKVSDPWRFQQGFRMKLILKVQELQEGHRAPERQEAIAFKTTYGSCLVPTDYILDCRTSDEFGTP